jgi:protein-S-isoprenylcysteine O-methyltransferase Ste14
MGNELKRQIVFRFLASPLMFGLPFLSAWTFNYWQAWLFTVVFLGACVQHTLFLLQHSPELLQRRLRSGPTAETRLVQRIIMALTTAAYIAILVVPGLDHRFHWSQVPAAVVIAADIAILISFAIFNAVCKENVFASATIEIAKEQKVISTGPYAHVRHPMYAGAVLLLFAMPISLGSYWAALITFFAMPILYWRIIDEERMLRAELTGYDEYCKTVKFRLIPGIC